MIYLWTDSSSDTFLQYIVPAITASYTNHCARTNDLSRRDAHSDQGINQRQVTGAVIRISIWHDTGYLGIALRLSAKMVIWYTYIFVILGNDFAINITGSIINVSYFTMLHIMYQKRNGRGLVVNIIKPCANKWMIVSKIRRNGIRNMNSFHMDNNNLHSVFILQYKLLGNYSIISFIISVLEPRFQSQKCNYLLAQCY